MNLKIDTNGLRWYSIFPYKLNVSSRLDMDNNAYQDYIRILRILHFYNKCKTKVAICIVNGSIVKSPHHSVYPLVYRHNHTAPSNAHTPRHISPSSFHL